MASFRVWRVNRVGKKFGATASRIVFGGMVARGLLFVARDLELFL